MIVAEVMTIMQRDARDRGESAGADGVHAQR